MTDKLIYKYVDGERWCRYYLRSNGTIRYENSRGDYARYVTPDSLINIIKLKTCRGQVYINVDALHEATGVSYI